MQYLKRPVNESFKNIEPGSISEYVIDTLDFCVYYYTNPIKDFMPSIPLYVFGTNTEIEDYINEDSSRRKYFDIQFFTTTITAMTLAYYSDLDGIDKFLFRLLAADIFLRGVNSVMKSNDITEALMGIPKHIGIGGVLREAIDYISPKFFK